MTTARHQAFGHQFRPPYEANFVYISGMSLSAEADGAGGAILVVTSPQPDDSGANTADRYDWQAAMAAADGLRLLLDALDSQGQLAADDTRRVICELHEDWVACHGDDAELVSAKHREPSYGAYTTLNMLAADGGLAHLFGRWCALNEKPTCRLVTTAGLGSGPTQGLEKACQALRTRRLAMQEITVDGDHADDIDAFARVLLSHSRGLPDDWQSTPDRPLTVPSMEHRVQVARFLAILTLDYGRPHRTFIPFAAPGMYVKPVLTKMGHSDLPPEPVWEAVLGLFRTRMRAAGPLPTGGLPAVLDYRAGASVEEPVEVERRFAARVITSLDIYLTIGVAIRNPDGYQPLKRAVWPNRMAVKMAAGKCSDNAIERADQLRLDHQEYWRTRISTDHTARAKQQQMRRALLRISDDATSTVRTDTEPWGPQFWRELQSQLDKKEASWWPESMDTDLRLGGLCDLANRCQVWFSDRFDADAELAHLHGGQIATP